MLEINYLKNISTDSLLVIVNSVGLYPSIAQETGLRALREVLDRRNKKRILKKLL